MYSEISAINKPIMYAFYYIKLRREIKILATSVVLQCRNYAMSTSGLLKKWETFVRL